MPKSIKSIIKNRLKYNITKKDLLYKIKNKNI